MPQAAIILTTEVYAKRFPKNTRVTMPQAAIILTTEVYAKRFPKNTRVTMPQAAIILTTPEPIHLQELLPESQCRKRQSFLRHCITLTYLVNIFVTIPQAVITLTTYLKNL